MTDIRTTETGVLQLDDARRECLKAAAALRCLAGDAQDATLLAEAQRIHSTLATLSDELADLRLRARVKP